MEANDIEEQNSIIDNIILEPNNNNNNKSKTIIKEDFRHITKTDLKIKSTLLKQIQDETLLLEKFFFEKLEGFPKIFEGKNLNIYNEVFNYLEKVSIPSKCECSGIIDNIPGWSCIDCSIYENSIYCSKCYLNSKDLHKDHKVEFLNQSGGMCDCGDPDSLYTFCHEHCGPYTNQKQIDEYINKVFPENILKNIKIFLDDIFYQLTKYLLLTEKCKLFYNKFSNRSDQKEDSFSNILAVKDNFAIIFQNFLRLFKKISEKNLAMLHILASYFLKNNLNKSEVKDNEKDQWFTTHTCIKIYPDNIEILYKDKNSNKNFLSPIMNFSGTEKHKCECPFLRLLVSNYRNNIKSLDQNETDEEQFLLSLNHNFFLRRAMCIIIHFLIKEVMFNNSDYIRNVRSQYFVEDALVILAQKSNIIEENFEFLYDYLRDFFEKRLKKFELGIVDSNELDIIVDEIKIYMFDSKIWSKPSVRKLMYPKININKRLIDIFCLFHKQLIFKSIVPHPAFQSKKPLIELIDMELFLLFTSNMLFLSTDWENLERMKEIFNYFVDKILFLSKNKTLENNEFSYHLSIYRYFGAFINFFCFNYAINNDTNINNSIEFVKTNLFRSKTEMDDIIKIILEEYYKFYGFIIGIKTGYFNYYELSNYYFIYFNDLRYLFKDLYLLKYLLAMAENPIKLNSILEKSNIEDIYTIFKSIFIPDDTTTSKKNNETKQSYISSVFNFLRHPISSITNYFYNKEKIDEKENKYVIQWKLILEIIIIVLKNDTMPLNQILRFYQQTVSSKTKNFFFDKVRNNKYLMNDCRNILKETFIQTIIANGNLMDLDKIKKSVEDFYLDFFGEKEYEEILEDVAAYKINGEKKQFYIKDSHLKYLDFNYYYSPMKKSKAELYISDFKKDVFKRNNSYYYNPSEFFFDFYNKAYENIFLCNENIELLTTILEVLLNPIYEERMKNYNPGSIRTIMLPVVFNYLSIFGCINSKGFYEFKLKNENLITKICNILNDFINTNKENKYLDSELAENIMELLKRLNSYKALRGYINDGIIKFNEKSYNSNEEELNINYEKNTKYEKKLSEIGLKEAENKTKIKNMKDKLKNMMKQKSGKFKDNALKNKNMKTFMEIKEKNDEENKIDNNDEITCFYCRNPINLKSFETPYGKLGLVLEDYFYHNSKISTLKSELNHIIQVEKFDDLKKQTFDTFIKKEQNNSKKNSLRITSCGHYFHKSCFEKGIQQIGFKCPLCEKSQNVLIPPLTNFYDKEDFLKPQLKLKDIFEQDTNNIIINNETIDNKNNIINNSFEEIILSYFKKSIKLYEDLGDNPLNFEYYIKTLFPKYQSYFNVLINLIYCDAMTFHKHQQIGIIKNTILSYRYFIHIKYINNNDFINHIHKLMKSFELNKGNYIINENGFRPDDVGYYNNILDELILCFCILFDYDEIKNLFILFINLILPYMCFFLYLRDFAVKNDLISLDNQPSLENISFDDMKKFLDENNLEIINYFKKFLHKFYVIKLLTDYRENENENKNTENIKKLSIEQLFTLLNTENIYNSLSKNEKNEIIFSDLFNKIPEQLSKYDYYNKNMLINYNDSFNFMINYIHNNKSSLLKINPDFIIQFIPYEFKFISLNNELFDFVEKYIFKKCVMCNKETKFYFICLVCGEKVCCTNICDLRQIHVKNCSGKRGIFLYISDMKLYIINSEKSLKVLYPLYVNESGVGPDLLRKPRDFKLSKENYEASLKEYVSFDSKL